MTCCDHPAITHRTSRMGHRLVCRCGAVTPYAASASDAWANESALSKLQGHRVHLKPPVGNCAEAWTPAAALPRQSGKPFNEVSQ